MLISHFSLRRSVIQGFILLLITAVGFSSLLSQNLVSNPSFEDVNCPIRYTGFPNQIDQYANGWRSGNCASPDLYAPCSQDSITRPPAAWYGRNTARTGTNFAAVGFYNIGITPWYEYLVHDLGQNLQAGKHYDLSFWVSRADSVRYATADLGIAFSSTEDTCVNGFEGPVLNYQPVVTSSIVLTDTSGWTKVAGVFTANGSERYLILGCFTPWAQLVTTDYNTGQNRCYYYIDDVEVKESGATSVELHIAEGTISPNPFSHTITIQGFHTGHVMLRDISGKILLQQAISPNTNQTFSTESIPSGVYIIEVISEEKVVRKKLIKNH